MSKQIEMATRAIRRFGRAMCFSALLLIAVVLQLSPRSVPDAFNILPASPIREMKIVYFLVGTFGGYGAFANARGNTGSYRLHLFVDSERDDVADHGVSARKLKAILYAPGCQFSLLSVSLVATPGRSARFKCRPLRRIKFFGRVVPAPANVGALDVVIAYQSIWVLDFFGSPGGPEQTYELTRAPLQADGRFLLEIPDFSSDGVTRQMQNAYLSLRVVDHSTSNVMQRLLPSTEFQYHGFGMKILPVYGHEVIFSPW